MISVIQGGTTASSHEAHGANHRLSTRDACSETETKARLGKPQLHLPMQNRKQVHSLANPCNSVVTFGMIFYIKTSGSQGTTYFQFYIM